MNIKITEQAIEAAKEELWATSQRPGVARRVLELALPHLTVEPEAVSSVDELNKLPAGSIVRGCDGFKHERMHLARRWLLLVRGESMDHPAKEIALPATVLYRP